nr:MAG TPA: hypothetical protein [Caudoviricetes sp.]
MNSSLSDTLFFVKRGLFKFFLQHFVLYLQVLVRIQFTN